MTPKERVLRTIKFNNPDRIPVMNSYLDAAFLKYGDRLVDLLKKYPDDFVDTYNIKLPKSERQYYKNDNSYYKEFVDEWNVTWACYQEGMVGQTIKHPLSDWYNLKTYKIPEHSLMNEEQKENVKRKFLNIDGKYSKFVWAGSLFEKMHYLRGYEELLMDIMEDNKNVYELADRIIEEHTIPLIKSYIEIGVEIMAFMDDWGTQQQLMINPKIWRNIFKPRYKKMFDICKQNGVLTYFHSDGMIMDILPDFIEIGLDVINPQFSCMDLRKLKEVCDHKICVCSDIDRQYILPFGKPDEVKKYVKEVFEIFVPIDGGFIAKGEVGPDVPLENVEAMMQSFYEFGKLKNF